MEIAQIPIRAAVNMVGVALVWHIVAHQGLHAAMVTGAMEGVQIPMIVAANMVGVAMVLLGVEGACFLKEATTPQLLFR